VRNWSWLKFLWLESLDTTQIKMKQKIQIELTVIQVVRDYQINYDQYNEPFAVSK